ncbi:MAG: hypothetical protein Tsb0014_00150 [Pleurocapsa sp.]
MKKLETNLKTGLLQASSNHLYSEIGEEAVILDINSGVYYGLNEVGVDIWNWLQEPKTATDILHLLLEEYEVTREQAEQDINEILQEMSSVGLINVVEKETV